ncbi:MAG: hypothetical protein ACR2Q3_06500 [Woeseiaceae bacterium]
MPRFLISLILLAFFAGSLWAQDEQTTTDADAASEDESVDEILEDDDLDEQVYEDDDDDFVPSEEIPADEPIPFPSNI